MVRATPYMLGCACWLLLSGGVFGQAYNAADYVRNLYHRYLNREPTANELTQWVWSFQKGLSRTEAQATFLSSDEYFRRYARDSSSFISGLFTDVLGRPPSPRESLRWLHTLNVSQGNRKKIVRDFLRVAEDYLSNSSGSSGSSWSSWSSWEQPSQWQDDTAEKDESEPENVSGQEEQLLATANLLHDAIEQELGGTHQGRQLSVQSRNLVNASRSLGEADQAATAIYQQGSDDVQAALAAVEQQMDQLHFSARTSDLYLDRFKQLFGSMVEEAAALKPLPVTQPDQPQRVSDDVDRDYLTLSTALLGDSNQLVYLLRHSASLEGQSGQLLRDIEFFHSRVKSLHQSLETGISEQDLRRQILQLRTLSRGITRGTQQSGQVGLAMRRWEIVLEDLREIAEQAGISPGSAIDPGQPVLINLPTYHHLPYRVHRPTAAQLTSQAIPLTDQAIAHIDAFVTGFNRFLHLSPRVPSLQSRARRLRVLLAEFRQKLANEAAMPQLRALLRQIDESLQAAKTPWTRAVEERRLANAPDLAGVSGVIAELKHVLQVD